MSRRLTLLLLLCLAAAAASAIQARESREGLRALLGRVSYSPTEADLRRAVRRGATVWLEEQLMPPATLEPHIVDYLRRFPTYGLPPSQVYLYVWKRGKAMPVYSTCGPGANRFLDFDPIHEHLVRQRLLITALTDHPLREMMVDFWLNHFNMSVSKNHVVAAWMGRFEADVRAHALGRFRDLLGIAAHCPGMLEYLDNASSNARVPGGLNENYGRELLELHTVGLEAGYSQGDVVQVARCLTGWTYDDERGNGIDGEAATLLYQEIWAFRFKPEMHSPGDKRIMGHRIPAGGVDEGERVLDLLARHPATARLLARKLAARFVCDDPPQALVDRLSRVYLATDGNIREVMRALLTSPELCDSRYQGGKMKTYPELVAGALRVTLPQGHAVYSLLATPTDYPGDTTTTDDPGDDDASDDPRWLVHALVDSLVNSGAPYNWKPPTGWPDRTETWTSTSGLRMRIRTATLVARLADEGAPAVPLDHLLALPLGDATRTALDRVPPSQRAALLLTSPEFQTR